MVDVEIPAMYKEGMGEEKRLLYIPDFEQDYGTYEKVIDSFVKTYSNTNYELLLYVEEDEFIEDKLAVLQGIFDKYEDDNCYAVWSGMYFQCQ